jgi:hypothetical protein
VSCHHVNNAYSGSFGPYKVFELTVSHQRYTWKIYKRYNELIELHKKVKKVLQDQGCMIYPPKSKMKLVWNRHDVKILQKRGIDTALYLENLGTIESLWTSKELMEFLEISKVSYIATACQPLANNTLLPCLSLTSAVTHYSAQYAPLLQLSFIPELGRKGKCGYLKKVRGGLFSSWRWRLVVAHDAYIATYIPGKDGVTATDLPEEVLHIDSGLTFVVNGRYLDIKSNSGKLALCAYTRRQANEWNAFMSEFYNVKVSPRIQTSPNGLTSFPSRCSLEEIEAFHCSRDYFHSLAVQLLNATSDIFITSAELSPTVLLTRPPLPPLRLHQILLFKANQGIKIYIMINREGNPSTASHNSTTNSYQVKAYLQNLSPNIKVIRITKAPNVGFQNEKLVVIDRVIAFTGSFDMNFGQYDDFSKSVEDEAGVRFPGHDYVQPCSNTMRPAKTVPRPVHKRSAAHQHQHQPPSTGQQQQQGQGHGPGEGQEGVPPELPPPTSPVGNNMHPILSNILEEEGGGGGGAGAGGLEERDMNNPDAPPLPLSMYDSTPFSFLQQRAGTGTGTGTLGGDMYGSMASHRTAQTEESSSQASQSFSPQGHIDDRMATLFADEEEDAAEEEERRSRASSLQSSVATTTPSAKKKSSLSDSLFNVLSTIGSGIEEAVTAFFQEEPFIDTREEHPRQPWHGVHMRLKGMAARDLSSHFIQKWRRHKTNSSQMDACVVQDITDDVFNSVCARCKCSNIFEDASVCPNCALPLGRISKYSQAHRTAMGPRCMPVPPEDYSYIVFECHFASRIGCLLHGQGPVAVEQLVNAPLDVSSGQLLFEQVRYPGSTNCFISLLFLCFSLSFIHSFIHSFCDHVCMYAITVCAGCLCGLPEGQRPLSQRGGYFCVCGLHRCYASQFYGGAVRCANKQLLVILFMSISLSFFYDVWS